MFSFPDAIALSDQIEADASEARRHGVTLFGAGGYARAARAALQAIDIEVKAFVVSGPSRVAVDGTPVVGLEDLDDARKQLPMWLAVYNRNRTSELKTLAAACMAAGVRQVRLPQEYFELIQTTMGWRYWLSDRRCYPAHHDEIEAACELLDDSESRRQFAEAVAFRIAPSSADAPLPMPCTQYFPNHVVEAVDSRGLGTTFVDCGAYDGDTISLAAKELAGLALSFAFEPDKASFASLARNVRSVGFPVVCIPCGLSDTTATVSFSVGQGEASAIVAGGGVHIQCVSLDQCLGIQEVDYLKLDVEGHELPALDGARRLIERCSPVMAVAAYHRWDDLWRIPEFFATFRRAYRLTYRAHQYNTFDGVFYAVPR